MSPTPQEEAIELFRQVVKELAATDHSIERDLRQCQHACRLLTWTAQEQWFQQELLGYASGATVPWYRKIHGTLTWEVDGASLDSASWQAQVFLNGLPPSMRPEDTTLEVRFGIHWLLSAAQTGYVESGSETTEQWLESKRKVVVLRQQRNFSAEGFRSALFQIQEVSFTFASQSYALLKYGSILSDIWADYQRRVDTKLREIKLGQHLESITTNLQSDNPECWRSAVFECRNMLNDVANYLWRDPRETYEYIDAQEPGSKLNVTQGKFANRLGAYAHQKGLRGTRGKFFRDEVERLAVSIRLLVALQSQAHDRMSREDTLTVAISTYVILGELATKTDLQPVTKYAEPAASSADVPPQGSE